MQTWDPERYASTARFVSDLGAPVIELLDPQPGERILDLGCGDGALTVALIEHGADVVGVDSSEAMVRAARERGVDARVSDGHALGFEHEFDAVFSNAALHWMLRPDDVIVSVARALKRGGRFVGEMGGHGCVAAVSVAIRAALARRGVDGDLLIPWYFPTPGDYATRLRAHGFEVGTMLHFPRPTPIPGDVVEWIGTFGGAFLGVVDDPEAVARETADLLRPSLCDEQGGWTVDYVRLRFAATLITA